MPGDNPMRAPIAVLASGLVLLALTALALAVGRFPLSPSELAAFFGALVRGDPVSPDLSAVVLQVRGPRVIAALLVGAALAGAGASYQTMFRNPLVSPDILGVSFGAALGAVTALYWSLDPASVQLAAFAGGLVAVLLVTALCARITGHDPMLSLVLTGVVVGSLFGALIAMTKYLADPDGKLPAMTLWMLGSFAAIGPRELAWLIPVIVAAAVPLFLVRWRINLLALPDEEARALGVDTRRLRGAVIVSATLLTSVAVSVSGIVGWVGLLMPHAARLIVGSDFRRLLPMSLALGAGFTLLVDTLCRTVAQIEIPPGVLTALLGAPAFLWLLGRTRRPW